MDIFLIMRVVLYSNQCVAGVKWNCLAHVGGAPKFGRCERKYFEIISGGKRGQHVELDCGGRSDWERYTFFYGNGEL